MLKVPIRPKVGSLIDMCASTIGRCSVPWQSWFDEYRHQGYDYQRCVNAIESSPPAHYFIPLPIPRRMCEGSKLSSRKILLSKTTLVIVPENLMAQWMVG